MIVTATREFDWGYVHEQFAELWIADYAEELLAVSRAIYRGDKLTDAQQDMVFRMISSGAYDTETEGVHPHSPCSRGRLPLVSRRAPAVFLV